MAIAETLLTAAEYLVMPENGKPTELVRGRLVPMNMAAPRHGQVCSRIVYLLLRYFEDHGLGHVVSNDSGIRTFRDPDTVRGADVAYYSYAKLPKGPLPAGYLDVTPDLVFEVRSDNDRWSEILTKVAEYLAAGVLVVCVLDPETESINVFRGDRPAQELIATDDFSLPDILGELCIPVKAFFS